MQSRVRAFLPGDKLRELRLQTTLDDESLDLTLLPIWSFTARDHPNKAPVHILLNAQTGAVHGKAPLSVAKVVAVSAGVLGCLIAATFFIRQLVH